MRIQNIFISAVICFLAFSALPILSEAANSNNSTQDNSDLRLELAKVSLYSETGKLDAARKLIDKLKAKYPNNPQVLVAEADLNLKLGNRGAGFVELNKAVILDPGNEDILDKQRSALLVQGPFTSGGFDFRRTNEAFEQLENFATQVTVSPSVSLELNVDNDHLYSREPLTRVNGSTENFAGDKQRGTFTLNKMFDSGDQASASIFANNNTPGAGAKYVRWDSTGSTALQGDFHRPDWDYAQMVIGDGTKDDIRLERKQFITNRIEATLGGGFNHYSLQDDFNAASAAAWDLNLGYTYPYQLSKNDQVTLGAYYDVDAEYFTDVDERTLGGVEYKPLPIQSYEVHSLNVSASKQLMTELYAEAYGGYGVDRFTGSNGPLFGGDMEYALMDNLGLQLRAFHGIMGGVKGSEKEDRLGASLKWRW